MTFGNIPNPTCSKRNRRTPGKYSTHESSNQQMCCIKLSDFIDKVEGIYFWIFHGVLETDRKASGEKLLASWLKSGAPLCYNPFFREQLEFYSLFLKVASPLTGYLQQLRPSGLGSKKVILPKTSFFEIHKSNMKEM